MHALRKWRLFSRLLKVKKVLLLEKQRCLLEVAHQVEGKKKEIKTLQKEIEQGYLEALFLKEQGAFLKLKDLEGYLEGLHQKIVIKQGALLPLEEMLQKEQKAVLHAYKETKVIEKIRYKEYTLWQATVAKYENRDFY